MTDVKLWVSYNNAWYHLTVGKKKKKKKMRSDLFRNAIHKMCRGLDSSNKCPGYDTKRSDGEASVLKVWGIWSIPSLLLLPGPLWIKVVAPDKLLSFVSNRTDWHLKYVQTNDFCKIELLDIELFDHLTNVNKWQMFNWIVSDT